MSPCNDAAAGYTPDRYDDATVGSTVAGPSSSALTVSCRCSSFT